MLRLMVEPPDGLDHPQDGAGLPTVGGGTDDQDAYEQQEFFSDDAMIPGAVVLLAVSLVETQIFPADDDSRCCLASDADLSCG